MIKIVENGHTGYADPFQIRAWTGENTTDAAIKSFNVMGSGVASLEVITVEYRRCSHCNGLAVASTCNADHECVECVKAWAEAESLPWS